MKKLLIVAIACLFVAGFSATAKAVSLAPGTVVSAAGDAPSTQIGVGSITPLSLPALPTYNFSYSGAFVGTFNESVYTDSIGLLFEYTFTNVGASGQQDALEVMAPTNFSGFITNVDAITGAGVFPTSIGRSADGKTINFHFFGTDAVSVGSTSDVLWVQTNAQNYTLSNLSFIDGGTDTVSAYGPATPEPATMLMFGMGALGLVGLRKRKLA